MDGGAEVKSGNVKAESGENKMGIVWPGPSVPPTGQDVISDKERETRRILVQKNRERDARFRAVYGIAWVNPFLDAAVTICIAVLFGFGVSVVLDLL